VAVTGRPPQERLIPLDVAAEESGRDRATLFRWIAQERLTPWKVRGDRRTYVDRAELMRALQAAPRRRGG
jgi:hypothetical protein